MASNRRNAFKNYFKKRELDGSDIHRFSNWKWVSTNFATGILLVLIGGKIYCGVLTHPPKKLTYFD